MHLFPRSPANRARSNITKGIVVSRPVSCSLLSANRFDALPSAAACQIDDDEEEEDGDVDEREAQRRSAVAVFSIDGRVSRIPRKIKGRGKSASVNRTVNRRAYVT